MREILVPQIVPWNSGNFEIAEVRLDKGIYYTGQRFKPPHLMDWGDKYALFVCDRLLMGRNPQADVVINKDTVSGRHVRLSCVNSNILDLEDLGSTNGTGVYNSFGEQ